MSKWTANFNRYSLAVGVVIIAGILLRIGHLLFIPLDAPFRLGGLYLEFSQQIINNHFLLPVHIPFYSEGGLPFAYPPLAFYVQAIFLSLLHPPRFLTVNLIPPIIASLSVPAFYYLAKHATSSRLETLAALFSYAFIPNTFLNQIEAAGLSESFGALFLIGYAAMLFKVTSHPTQPRVLLAGLLLACCVLSNPGSALAASIISLLFAIQMARQAFFQHTLKLIFVPLSVGLLGVALSAPYWITVMVNHGRGIFLVTLLGQFPNEAQPANFLIQYFTQFLTFSFAGGSYSFLWNSMIFVGLIVCLTGTGFYIGLAFVFFALIPREGVWISALAAALLAGKGLTLFIFPLVQFNLRSFSARRAKTIGGVLLAFFLAAVIYNSVESVISLVHDRQWSLSAQQVADLEQYSQVIPQDAKVIVLGNDAVREWAPQLLRREVINTDYGLEWQPYEIEKVQYLNEELIDAENIQDILTAIDYFHLDEVYMVTTSKDRLTKIIQASNSDRVFMDMLADGRSLNIVYIATK